MKKLVPGAAEAIFLAWILVMTLKVLLRNSCIYAIYIFPPLFFYLCIGKTLELFLFIAFFNLHFLTRPTSTVHLVTTTKFLHINDWVVSVYFTSHCLFWFIKYPILLILYNLLKTICCIFHLSIIWSNRSQW